MQILSVQTNQQYDKPNAFQNRRSPLAQWNVQAMEIWGKKLARPPLDACTMDLQKATERALYVAHASARCYYCKGHSTSFPDKGLWLPGALKRQETGLSRGLCSHWFCHKYFTCVLIDDIPWNIPSLESMS